MNVIRIVRIIKMLKKALDVKTIKEVEYQLKDFYTRYGVIENKHRKCETCKHQHTMNCPNSKDCYAIDYKPFYESKGDE